MHSTIRITTGKTIYTPPVERAQGDGERSRSLCCKHSNTTAPTRKEKSKSVPGGRKTGPRVLIREKLKIHIGIQTSL